MSYSDAPRFLVRPRRTLDQSRVGDKPIIGYRTGLDAGGHVLYARGTVDRIEGGQMHVRVLLHGLMDYTFVFDARGVCHINGTLAAVMYPPTDASRPEGAAFLAELARTHRLTEDIESAERDMVGAGR